MTGRPGFLLFKPAGIRSRAAASEITEPDDSPSLTGGIAERIIMGK